MTGSLGPVHIGLAIECLDALAFSATGERAGSPMIAFGYYAVPDLTSASARGCRVITVPSGGFKTIPGWLREGVQLTV
jgi:hypothetical protein